MTTRRAQRHPRLAVFTVLLVAAWTTPAVAVKHLKRGDLAPVIVLRDLDGAEVRTADRTERTLVLVFGELYHDRTLQVCGVVQAAIADPTLADETIEPLLVIAQAAPPAALRSRATDPRLPEVILHDPERRAFGAYRVTVMPSVVVVDAEGRVVHAIAGLTSRFADTLTDALRLTAGRLSPEQFAASLRPASADAANPELVRAARMTSLARQLVRRGMDDLAGEEYTRALEVVPDYAPARLGQALLLLRRGRLAEAEQRFRDVLAAEPGSAEAVLGLAYVLTLRGAEELPEAEALVRAALVENPTEPRAHYLLGLIHDALGDPEASAASYRTAAVLLMSRRETWNVIPTEAAK